MTIKQLIVFGVVVVAVSLLGSWFLLSPKGLSATFGATNSVGNLLAEHYLPYVSTNNGYNTNLGIVDDGTFRLGTTGTVLGTGLTGVCYLQVYSATIPATTTAVADCQGNSLTYGLTTANDTLLPGVATGGFSLGVFSTTTATKTSAGLVITGFSASSTAGYFTVTIANLTGATYTWPVGTTATGTVKWIDFH